MTENIDKCAICLEDLSDNIYKLPECSHTFHMNCIMHWFRSQHHTCPLCNNPGINSLYQQSNTSYELNNTMLDYYRMASYHCRTKKPNKLILKKMKSLRKIQEKIKKEKMIFKTWTNQKCDPNLTNDEIRKLWYNKKPRSWRRNWKIRKSKITIGHLYYTLFINNKIIIAEKVNI